MRPTLIRAAGVGLLTAGIITPALATAASAAPTGICTTITVNDPETLGTTGGGTVQFPGPGGVIMSTPEQGSKVTYRRTLSAPVPFTSLSELSYLTDRQDGATGADTTVAAYKLGVDADGNGSSDGTLVYEPYYNGPVGPAEQTHNVLGEALSGKWWYSAEPGNKQTLSTFAQWTTGKGAVAFTKPQVLWFGVEQGTYNTGAITLVNKVKFKTTSSCTLVQFQLPKGLPDPDPTTKPTVTPTKTGPTPPVIGTHTETLKPTATVSTKPTTTPESTTTATATATTEPPAAGGGAGGGADDDNGALPTTGPALAIAGGIGLIAVAGGTALLAVSRRRRSRFVA